MFYCYLRQYVLINAKSEEYVNEVLANARVTHFITQQVGVFQMKCGMQVSLRI
jgi:hypothetical protein